MIEAGVKVGVIAPDVRSVRAAYRLSSFGAWFRSYEYTLAPGNGFVYRKIAYNLLPYVAFWNRYFFHQIAQELFEQYIKHHGLPDVIHAHTALLAGREARLISARTGIPYVVTEHSSAILKQNMGLTHRLVVKKVYEQASRVISVSTALKEAIGQQFGVGSVVIPNVIDTNDFPLGTTHDRNIIFGLGTLLKAKGFDVLIRAFALARLEIPALKLVIGGAGPERATLERLAKQLDITADVTFTGELNRREVAAQMHRAGIFVSPSHYETFGVVLVEAAATGMPLVATDSGGTKDIINETTGLLCPKNNVGKLKESIVYVHRNFNSYDPITISNHIHTKFGKHFIAHQLKEEYVHAITAD